MYNLDWLKAKYDNNETLKYIFFWKNKPSEDGSIIKTCMSQWWENYPFEVDGIRYETTEHWMMAGKARLFNDDEILQEILADKTPAKAQILGRKVRNYNGEIWRANNFEIVAQGNFHKFSQHEDLKSYLLNTGNKVLVEASPLDKIWGNGLAEDAPTIENPHTWTGQNLLGFALMEARDRLRKA